MLNINMEFRKGVLFVRLIGSLNELSAHKLIDTVLPVVIKSGIKYLVYNFNELESIDDVGKKSLLLGYNEILKNHGNVLVLNNRFKLEHFKETKNELTDLEILKV